MKLYEKLGLTNVADKEMTLSDIVLEINKNKSNLPNRETREMAFCICNLINDSGCKDIIKVSNLDKVIKFKNGSVSFIQTTPAPLRPENRTQEQATSIEQSTTNYDPKANYSTTTTGKNEINVEDLAKEFASKDIVEIDKIIDSIKFGVNSIQSSTSSVEEIAIVIKTALNANKELNYIGQIASFAIKNNISFNQLITILVELISDKLSGEEIDILNNIIHALKVILINIPENEELKNKLMGIINFTTPVQNLTNNATANVMNRTTINPSVFNNIQQPGMQYMNPLMQYNPADIAKVSGIAKRNKKEIDQLENVEEVINNETENVQEEVINNETKNTQEESKSQKKKTGSKKGKSFTINNANNTLGNKVDGNDVLFGEATMEQLEEQKENTEEIK